MYVCTGIYVCPDMEGKGSADFDDIWKMGQSYAVVVPWRKLASQTPVA